MSDPTFHVQSVTFESGSSGKLDQAKVLVMLSGFEPEVTTPWFQVTTSNVLTPEDAVLKAREPLLKFLKQAEDAARKMVK